MVTKTDYGLRVKERRTELIVFHHGEDLTFLHPPYGPNTYANVGLEIGRDGLARPTAAETSSLVHGVFNSDDTYSSKIKGIMEKRWLWAFTGTLYIPTKGAYIQDNPKIEDGIPFMEESDLVKKLEANNPSVRLVHFGFKVGSQTALELANNPYIIGLVGEEGAEKLGEVADKYRGGLYLESFESVHEPTTRVSTFYYDRNSNYKIWVSGCNRGSVGGYAFGV